MAYVIAGTFSLNNRNMQPQLVYSYTQNKDANQTTINLTFRVQKLTSYAQTWKSQTPYSITINGSTVKSSITNFDIRSTPVGGYTTVATYTGTYNHNADGSLSLKLGATVNLSATNPGVGTVGPTTVQIAAIPRSSYLTPSKNEYTLGDTFSGTIHTSSNTFCHKITMRLVDDSSKAETFNVAAGVTSVSHTIPTSWINSKAFANSTSTLCCIEVRTYKDSNYSTQIGDMVDVLCTLNISTSSGSVSGYFTFSVGSLSIVSNDSNTYKNYLLNKTKCKISNIVVTPKAGSTVKYIRITGSNGYDSGLLTYSSGMSHTTSVLTTLGTIKYTITITDSRGITTSYTNANMSIKVIEYLPPTFKSVITSRATSVEGNIEESDDGEIIKSVIDFSYFTQDSTNKVSKLEMSLSTGAKASTKKTFTYQTNNTLTDNDDTSLVYTGIKNGDSYYYTLYWNAGLKQDESYTITYKLIDSYGSTSYIDEISSAFFILDISPSGKSIAIGKAANEDEYGLEISMPKVRFTFNGDDYLFDGSGMYVNNDLVKLIKQKHNATSTSGSIILNSDSCYYTFKNALKSLNVSVADNLSSSTYACNKVNFMTDSSFKMTSSDKIYYVGTNCNSGTITPQKNSFYSIEYEYALNNVLGKVIAMPITNTSSGGSSGGGGTTDTPTVSVKDGPTPCAGVTELLEIAKGYYNIAKNNKFFEYGTESQTALTYGITESNTECSGSTCTNKTLMGAAGPHTNSSGLDRRYIDDSTFVGLCLRGIAISASRYADWNTYDSEFRPSDYEWSLDLRDTLNVSTSNGGIRTAADIAKYCDTRGWMIDDSWHITNYTKLKAGDLIFWDDDNKDNGRWSKVSRVGICLGTEIYDKTDFNKKYPNESTTTDMLVMEVVDKANYSGTHYGIRIVKLKDSSPDKVVHVARLQYKAYATCTVNNSAGANLRTGPSSALNSNGSYVYSVIKNVPNGTVLSIIDETNGRSKIWYKVLYDSTNRKTAWVSSTIVSNVTQLNNSSSSSTTTTDFTVPCYGIDVSKHQGTMDFAAIKKAGSINFAILRMGFGGRSGANPTLDSQFVSYLNGCKANGIPVGIYFFSYANSLSAVQKEANWVVEQLAKYPKTFEFPIFFDQEYDSLNTTYNSSTGSYTTNNPGKAALTSYMNAFCKIINDAGYMAGIYANPDWFANYVNFNDVQYKDHIWIAQWGSSLSWNKADVKLWQTGVSKINGYSGDVDYDKCLFNYPNHVRSNHLHGF